MESIMTNKYMVEVIDLVKRFPKVRGEGEITVLNNVNLKVEKGKFVVLVGPSGCGKSTLLNIINGLIEPTSGKILIDGKDMREDSDFRKKMGYVFQSPRLLEWRTLKENVIFGLKCLRKQPKEKWNELAEKYLRLVGLSEFMNYYPLQVSGGMQQRVAIARAWANEPKILLMDEPFSHLDEITARTLRRELIKLWTAEEEKKTILFVTHDMREAVYLADEVYLMTNRPSSVYRKEVIDLPRDRDLEDPAVFKVLRELTKTFYSMMKRGEGSVDEED
jgi:NitT/TauT family transport system ATP-binding protein